MTICTKGELGSSLARIILQYQPRDIRKMEQNFGSSIRDLYPNTGKNSKRRLPVILLGTVPGHPAHEPIRRVYPYEGAGD